jgi:hypothetical protein
VWAGRLPRRCDDDPVSRKSIAICETVDLGSSNDRANVDGPGWVLATVKQQHVVQSQPVWSECWEHGCAPRARGQPAKVFQGLILLRHFGGHNSSHSLLSGHRLSQHSGMCSMEATRRPWHRACGAPLAFQPAADMQRGYPSDALPCSSHRTGRQRLCWLAADDKRRLHRSARWTTANLSDWDIPDASRRFPHGSLRTARKGWIRSGRVSGPGSSALAGPFSPPPPRA